ncbi:DNA methyltransferase [Staphylococcus saprophyticus]|uniref:DNA methyltransferase n=1 Tax=Staphylococcus saprophyticus TaxID=29385 RepID=UPI000F70CA11|nr:site-specific DNA-methyltransferase [Staphylococcus saprophyticus]VDZ22055.1 type III restriction/modification enzyme methylation subunit [Staphylococcus saprophyticus]
MSTNILNEISDILNDIERYWTNEKLAKQLIIEDLRNNDTKLISKLLSSQSINETYVQDIDGYKIFDKEAFISMLRYKNYWKDSYTKYTNKIGLTAEGKYLNYNSDVILDFPFKDCILEGGMTKEDSILKNDEKFYNEVIAKEEIDTLLTPKVLKNIKRYDVNGKHKIDKLEENDNLIIKGNNLIALYSIEEQYKNKIDLIYIDVPYYFNNHKEYESFKYNSNFHQSTWLTFLKNRLVISKSLLSTNGSIWVHVGEDGMHYLKVLMDSIFGSDKFIGTVPRKTREGKNDVPYNFSQDFDFILIYTNGEKNHSILNRKVNRQYLTTDDFPERPWRKGDIKQQKNYIERPNSYFDMVNPKTGKVYPVDKNNVWRVTKETFNVWYEKGYIGFPDDYEFMKGTLPFRRSFKDEDDMKEDGSSVFSDFLLKEFSSQILGRGKSAKNDTVENFDFNYAKPESLIKSIIEVSTNENDIILDYFMGSATTQAVAHKMNRQYIGIEQMDYINSVSVPRLQKVIEGEQGGISKDVEWQGGGSFVYAELTKENLEIVEDVINCSSEGELKQQIDKLLNTGVLNYEVDFDEFTNTKKEFSELELEDQKEVLIRILDNNQLYVNYSDIEDSAYNFTEDEKAFNHSFYGGE